jgi:TetR/AcrR family transcriptional repressor of nem operon
MMAKKKQFNEVAVLSQISQYFWDHGYFATKMDELSALTGLTKSSLYNAFGNKESLFTQSVDFYIEQQLAPFKSSIAETLSLSDAVSGMLEMKFSDQRNPLMTQGCLLTNSILELKSNESDLHAYVIKGYEEIHVAMATFFEWFVKNNKVVEGISALQLTDLFITFQQGLNVQSRNLQAKESMARGGDLFLTLLKTLEVV